MVKFSFVKAISNYLPREAHALHDLKSVFVHVHGCEVLGYRTVVRVG